MLYFRHKSPQKHEGLLRGILHLLVHPLALSVLETAYQPLLVHLSFATMVTIALPCLTMPNELKCSNMLRYMVRNQQENVNTAGMVLRVI